MAATISDVKLCRAPECRAKIRFIMNPATGKLMPVDAEKVRLESGAKAVVVTDEGRVVKDAPVGTVGYIPHWITCKNAKAFKKPPSSKTLV